MSRYTVAWISWILVFLVFEGMAIIDRRPGDTFTEHFRRWLKLTTLTAVNRKNLIQLWVTRMVIILFGAWLTVHMAFGWFGGGEGFLG